MKKVSIITVNYNQMEVTLDLLKSIGTYNDNELEVIVVDNGSKIDETATIEAQFPQTKIIRSDTNLGFAGGNNLGIKVAKGDYLFLINNDTIIPKGTISNLKIILENDTNVAIVCPLIYYYDHPNKIQYAGFTAINSITGRNKALHFHEEIKPSNKLIETEYAHGAAMMIKKEVVDKLGMMSENYFLYYEELDWVHRIRRSGLKVMVDHSSHILHKESISTGKSSPLKTYFQTRNRILFMRRNFKGFEIAIFFLFFTLISIPKTLIFYILKNNYTHLKAFTEGIKWNLHNSKNSDKLGYIYDSLRYH